MTGSYLRTGWLLLLALTSLKVASQEVKYPNIDGIGKESIGLAVLQLALEKSSGEFNVTVDKRSVNQNRARIMVESGGADVFDTGFQKDLEQRFLPIYLPLEMGLLGWRIPIIHKDTAAKLQQVKTLNDVTTMSVGQGQGWGDIPILENAGFKVVTASKIEKLIKMVEGKRFDLFPLGATEVYQFLDKFGASSTSLIVDSSITIVYPYGRFFYVHKDNQPLADAIKQGMEAALSDGSLIELLKTHPFSKDALGKADLQNRVKINIESPGTNDSFKNIDEKWWYQP
ncbi:hypothetical protein ACFFUP_00025 [Vibrio ostreicida]|uniref:Amino acid ABC transporter substrate-binding protein n=1 Tax=Vibrio ostreicida TaxID=526588 RepID=A0ABT8BTE0_9VIBR|nr:hypothetical protein [Vibrio ostreicida]MDN3610047.1 hypothetical protein [Vibrio ostreicida]NPD10081.1 hypothetical protein [Vibrio ostreicida]